MQSTNIHVFAFALCLFINVYARKIGEGGCTATQNI
jgi:hypothetical protein